MSTTLLLARRNLARNRIRLLVSVGGVALALSLTLALDAIYAGVANQLTTYIDRAGADIWVAQAGVRNLHMVASWLPDSVTAEVRSIDGVVEVTPILYSTDTIAAGEERAVAYVIGLPAGGAMGGPWDVVEGSALVRRGEIIVDRAFAEKAGVAIGDAVSVLGGEARIVGLSEGTASLVNSVAFVAFDDFRAMRGGAPVVSFVLVKLAAGAAPDAVAADIERRVVGVTAQPRAGISAEERRLVTDMSADIISIMNVIGFVVGLAVVALTVYVATLARRREYGVLKALGTRNRILYRVVLVQAVLSVAMGFLAGVAFTGLLALVIPRTGLDLELSISAASLAKVGSFAAVIAGLAAILPIRQISGLDPAIVFRRGAAI
ncbi:MAG TPA: ABC transporter permease [Candidatus Limnocylindrales bacterium]|nr:ABC transporter permease [Candidatus Limnocylindrales bacterium]